MKGVLLCYAVVLKDGLSLFPRPMPCLSSPAIWTASDKKLGRNKAKMIVLQAVVHFAFIFFEFEVGICR